MNRHARIAVLAAAMAAMLNGGLALAADREQADPAVYLQAFNDTCRRGFPDLDAVAAKAMAQGWQESSMRPVSGAADIFSASLPRAFHRSGLMLFLTRPNGGEAAEVCQISGAATTKLSGADVAAIVSPSLNTGPPVVDKAADHDAATWTMASGITVRAGIAIYRKVRTISISAYHAR